MAAAITGGSISLPGVVAELLDVVLEKLLAAGCAIHIEGDRIGLRAPERLRAVDLAAEPYPGPPTDVQAQWTALMTTADGVSTVRDRVFGQRFLHVAELNRLGADIVRRGDAVVIRGVRRLEGAALAASDLRASAALVLAGLAADGQTTLSNIFHLDRGYQRLDEKLRRLGAQIHRTTGQTQRAGHSPYETNS